jgi:hypothetical protein
VRGIARSFITGIPKGRFSSVPDLGIQTRRVGFTFELGFNLATSDKRASGDSDLIPSTPAVFFPWLSCVTRRTDRHFAAQEFISVFWSLRNALTSPRRDAL